MNLPICLISFLPYKCKKSLYFKGFSLYHLSDSRVVEVTGLEPAASCSQSKHSSQTELHLEIKFCVEILMKSADALVALSQNCRLNRIRS